jgi:hypothetical protein
MSPKKIAPIVIMVLVIAAAFSIFLFEKRRTEASLCPACNREIHSGWSFTLAFKDGKTERLCCAKCGILAQINQDTQVLSAMATDFPTGKPVQAEKALYVWNSDIEHCPVPSKRDSTNQQPMQLAWDRCIPSLIAFENRSEAEKLQAQHGGKVVNYADSIPLVQPPASTP